MVPRFVLSVVTVVLNDAVGFARTTKSILGQSAECEWIVVDGGSSDGTRELVAETTGVSWWSSEPDGGIYEAMNKGIRNCSGDFVIFMNAGDTFADSISLETLVVLVSSAEPDVVLGGTYQMFGGAAVYRKPKDISWIAEGLPAFHQSTAYRRELLLQYPYDESYRLLADYAWLAAGVKRGLNLLIVDLPISRFFVGGRSYGASRKKMKELCRVKSEILGVSRARARFGTVVAVTRSYMVTAGAGVVERVFRVLERRRISRPSGTTRNMHYRWARGG